MLKVAYKNPLTEIYQKEYAIYMLLCDEFKKTECNSKVLETLELYYAELVKINDNGHPSYEKQYELEEECEKLMRKRIIGHIQMPSMNQRTAKVSITTNEDGTHSFTFRSGVFYFTYRFYLQEIEDEKAKGQKEQSERKRYKVFLEVVNTQGPTCDYMKSKGNGASLRKGA